MTIIIHQIQQSDIVPRVCTGIGNVDNKHICESENSSWKLYDAIHDASRAGFQGAHFTRESPSSSSTQRDKGWDSSVSNTSGWFRVETGAPSEPLFPLQILTPLSSNPVPWERLCPLFRIPSVKNSLNLLLGLMHRCDRVRPTTLQVRQFSPSASF